MTAAAAVETVDGSAAAGPAVDAGAVPVRRHTTVDTELGELTLVGEGAALVGVYFPEHRPEPDATRFGEAVEVTDDPVLAAASEQLAAYVSGHRTTIDVPVRADGSERAREVWDLVAAVPRGETTTYAALGRAVGVGPRVAGQMVARNPLCVVVPCHRVVASDGRLTGYAGGVDRKRQLLQLEGALAAGAVKASPVRAPAPPETSTAAEVDG
ncbi:methylated-DNA--[protein]-cysteine S-methyltransferase [Microlunatus antarcticus]|uniref:Methylated-DNA-[protein]-cysteine S-methyltransferase n=1 Tax=Microlunatus antarcticus TaxID=53388 RepID=A0A7W5JT67_9ACTN|nr:methylated-DNA--[protein]-cysteine S-methyltransferase [Microlunatus antarcticus]MBB3325795.1 methylated-DNA-[protein]-cysteine S-methyltransferase [Microlunatus antarcticus]